MTERLEVLLATQGETALLRFGLGNAYLTEDPASAIAHLERAVVLDPAYSAAWKLLGRAFAATGQGERAIGAYRSGIAAAQGRGDLQAAREMQVFLRRLTAAGND